MTSALNRQTPASALSRAITIGAELASDGFTDVPVFKGVGSKPPMGMP